LVDSEEWTVNSEVRNHRDLLIWQKGIALVKEIYLLSQRFPRSEIYGLSNQIRRAAVSIPSNIAEGQSRQHTGEFRQFLHVALGSLAEVDTQLVIAKELSYLPQDDMINAEKLTVELRKMIHSLIKKLPNN
jgi:four helix bundle protein